MATSSISIALSPASACPHAHPRRYPHRRQGSSTISLHRRSFSLLASTNRSNPDVPYQVLRVTDTYELRIYAAYYVACAPYSNREQGIASLMGYLEGGNERGTTFRATQPLVMRYVQNPEDKNSVGISSKTMELSLGKGVNNPPLSNQENVTVRIAGGELLAVVPFTGIATPELTARWRESLTSALIADGITLAEPGAFRLATYGQLYSLKPRLNELILHVKLPNL